MKYVDGLASLGPTRSMGTWRQRVEKSLADDEREAIDKFETQIGMRRRGDLDEKLFAETRLRMGVYARRYDNGKRHDGNVSRELVFRDDRDDRDDCGLNGSGEQVERGRAR